MVTTSPARGEERWQVSDNVREAAQAVARAVWESREEYRPQVLSPEEAIAAALAQSCLFVVDV